jgi:diadenosine tetraphosphate (Ap4A) HIT family hydrolase
MTNQCPFCELITSKSSRIVDQNDLAFVIRDGYPISEGHTLIIPKRHIGSFFEATDNEREILCKLVDLAKKKLDKDLAPDGYNIGINDGMVAGQTVPHLHIHLIPRYKLDVKDPRGGVRWIIPDKAVYWSDSK